MSSNCLTFAIAGEARRRKYPDIVAVMLTRQHVIMSQDQDQDIAKTVDCLRQLVNRVSSKALESRDGQLIPSRAER